MKWSRGLHHLRNLAGECARLAELAPNVQPLRVTELWTYGPFLDERVDLDWVNVAVVADVPEVPWLAAPRGAGHWSHAAKLKGPLSPMWRSANAPVWNHTIVRPLLLWSLRDGVEDDVFTALEQDKVDRPPAPSAEQLAGRIDEELAISLRAMRDRVDVYDKKRWAPGKLEPYADDLFAVTNGYLDLLDAMGPR
jgi:hypothetical protein